MPDEKSKISFQKAWHIQVPGLKLLDFASDHHSFVACDRDSVLRLFNSQGQELWHRNAGQELIAVSLADTLEVLAIDSEKHSMLFGPEGATLWRKRPFPAIAGKISASGDSFAFVTSDPAIIGADRSLRVKWAYRNLMKRPAAIAISALGQTSAFPCCDDRGEGLSAVSHLGKPFDAFMGIGVIIDLELNEDGQIVLAVSENGQTYCLNLVKGCGIWKGNPGQKSTGVSFASKTGESLVYSAAGQIMKLNPTGEPLWEHWFPDRLLKVSITADGSGIFYATERGEIGLLTQADRRQKNRMTFREIPIKPLEAGESGAFRKIWAKELPGGGNGHHSEICSWTGQDGVEYSLIWDGAERLLCLNDIGEEIWQERLIDTDIISMHASSQADMAIIVSSSGVTGYDLSGSEIFRFFGQFCGAHVFDDGAMLLLDTAQNCRYYQAFDHFSHQLEINGPALQVIPCGEQAVIRSDTGFLLIDSAGNVSAEKTFDSTISFLTVSFDNQFIVCGTESGLVSIFDATPDTVFAYRLSGCIISAAYNRDQETIFVGTADEKIFILQRRTGQMMQTTLTGRPLIIMAHEIGAVIGTDLDQLGLINTAGQVLARYTLPFTLRRLLPSHRRLCMMILADESIGCIAAVESNSSPAGQQNDS